MLVFPYKKRYTNAEYADMWKLIASEMRFRPKGGAKGVKKWSKNDKDVVRNSFFALFGHQGNKRLGVEATSGLIRETRARTSYTNWRWTDKLKRELGQGDLPTKYAYVPASVSPKTGKPYQVFVEHRDDEPDIITMHGVNHRTVEFDPDAMLVDSEREVERKLQDLDDLGMFKGTYGIVIDVGRHQITNFEFDEHTVSTKILQLQSQYGNQAQIVKRHPSRHWSNWLRGLTVRKANRQKTLKELRTAIELHKTARRKGHANHVEYMKKAKKARERYLKSISGNKTKLFSGLTQRPSKKRTPKRK